MVSPSLICSVVGNSYSAPMKQIKVQPVYRDVRRRHRHTMHEMMKIIGHKTAAMLARYAIHVPMTWRW